MDVESAFNMLVKLARSNKLTWEEHQRVAVAIDTVLEALNQDTNVTEVRHINEGKGKKK